MTRRILLLISLTAILTTAVLHSQQPVLQPQAVQLAEVRSPEEMDEHITGLYKRKFYDLAQKEAETFLQRYPNHDRAQVISEILIDCLCRQQLNDQAIFLLRNFLKVHSAHEQWSRFALQLGELLYAKGTYAEAESCFAQAAEKSREKYLTAFAEYNRALCLIKLERRPEARTILESLAAQKLEGKGDTAETQALHLGILVKSRLFAAQFKSEDKDYKGALDIYQKLLASGKLDENARSETLEHAATISFEYLNDYKGAALFAGRHYAEFPASPRRAYIRQIFLYSLFHSRNYSQFLKSFREYLQETPDGATSSMLMMCIQAAAEQKLPEEELKWINILLALPKAEPRHVAEARNQRVFVLYRMGQEKEAAAEALKFISEYPSNTAGYNNVLQLLAHISVNAGDFTAAAKYLETLLGLVKDNPREYSIVAGQLASAYQNLKEWSKAADAAVKAASTAEKEQQPALLLYAAQCADYAGDFKLTVQLCDTAVQRAPENPDVHNKALEIKYNSAVSKQHTADAAKIAREAVQRFSAASQHVIWLYRLANIQIHLQQYDESIDILRKILFLQDVPGELRTASLDMLIQLFCYRKRASEALDYLSEAFKVLPPAKPSVTNLTILANAAEVKTALVLWARIENHPSAGDDDRDNARVRRAALLLESAPSEAEAIIAELEKSRRTRGKDLPPDAFALSAELALNKKAYAAAHISAERALSMNELSPEAEAQALWVMAKSIYDSDRDLDRARSYATRIFVIGSRSPKYSPPALHLTAKIYREMGKNDVADEIEAELKRDFPGWKPDEEK